MQVRIHLEPEQAELFKKLVEALKSRPRPERDEFTVIRTSGPDLVQGNGIQLSVLFADIQILVDGGLLAITNYHTKGSGFNFTIPPHGLSVYEEIRKQTGGPIEQIEGDVTRYLAAEEFQSAYPAAYARWKEASDLLWSADSEQELSTIGHKCREAVQEFATMQLERHGISDANPDRSKTRDRLGSVLKSKHEIIGQKHRALLDGLFAYWTAAVDLLQRQEHAGQREGEALIWEDGRRAVFQTAIVMFEIDRSI
jgi:hypothetical protein